MAYEIPTRWPLVTTPSNRSTSPLKDGRLVNCYAELNPETGEYTVQQRLGFSGAGYTPATGAGRGMFFTSNVAGFGSVFYIYGTQVWSNNIVRGTVAAHDPSSLWSGKFYFTQMFSDDTNLFFDDANNAYYTDGVTVTHVTDPNFPPLRVPGSAYLNGRLYVMSTDGTITGATNIDDASAWDPLNTIVAQTKPDRAVFLTSDLTYIIAMKEWSTEIFYDSGNAPGSSLAPVQGGFISYGCFAPDSVQEMDGILIWVTNNQKGALNIVRMDNLQIQIITTPAVERLLEGALGVANIPNDNFRSFTVRRGGHRFYVLTSLTNNMTMVYDLDQQLWSEWFGSDQNCLPYVDSCTNPQGAVIVQHATNGTNYQADTCFVYPDDLGVPFYTDIYTPNFDAKIGRQKNLSNMYFNADRQLGSTLYVRCNDNDFDPTMWTNFRPVNLGNKRPMLTNCGTFYRRAYHFRKRDSFPLRLTSVDLQMALCTL